MLTKHPKRTPPLADMLADLGNPTDKDIAKALCVSERMAKQWRKKDDAPRTVLLALFWVTHWGQQWADAETFNRAQLDYQEANALRRQVKELEQIIARLVSIADFGSANDPSTAHHHRASNPAARMSHASLRLSCLTPVVQPGRLETGSTLQSQTRITPC
jgi:hypothetical protein